MLCDCSSHRHPAAVQFGRAKAEKELTAYRRDGPGRTTRLLLAGLRAVEAGGTLLDVGAGMGALTFELLAQGISHATCVELAPESLAVAQEEAARRHLAERISWYEADFANGARDIPPADIVTLDKVVCCYPAFAPLLANAAAHCRTWLALAVPRGRWYVRGALGLENLGRRVRGNAFRTFVHPVAAMEEVLADAGLRAVHSRHSIAWQASIYARRAT